MQTWGKSLKYALIHPTCMQRSFDSLSLYGWKRMRSESCSSNNTHLVQQIVPWGYYLIEFATVHCHPIESICFCGNQPGRPQGGTHLCHSSWHVKLIFVFVVSWLDEPISAASLYPSHYDIPYTVGQITHVELCQLPSMFIACCTFGDWRNSHQMSLWTQWIHCNQT